jgi:CHAT domain-containing protein
MQRSVPSAAYHNAFAEFYDGEYRAALDRFAAENRNSIKTPQSRWIDSICYETMMGECYHEMGHLNDALEHYTAALKIYLAFSDWMAHVQFPATIRPAGVTARLAVPWGASTRRAPLGFYPQSMPILQGQIDFSQQVQHGGVVQQANLFPIEVQEIVRCTTLAIRHRAKLLGPLAARDPLFNDLVAAMSGRVALPNHWSEAWVGVELGLALSASGREGQAVAYLQRSVVAAGEFDHPMTSIALLELGRLAMIRSDFPAALKYFEEASYAAVAYPDPGVLEEAFRYGALAHLMSNQKGVFPPLTSAIQWAKVKHLRQLHASLLLLAAENYAVLGQTGQTAGLLDDARVSIGRRDMGNGRIGARRSFLDGLCLFQQKKIPDGDKAVAAAMDYMRHGSYWLFQIGQADILAMTSATPRMAMDLYQEVLRDPRPADWSSDPLESLAVLVVPHPLPFEHWFETALARKDHEAAVEIGDRMRRHRFFTSLPFGGRLLSLRWVLEAPDALLDRQSQLHRQDLLTRYPAYEQLRQQAHALHDKLIVMPIQPDDKDVQRQQAQMLAQLTSVSQRQELILREMAVRREPAGLLFPPLRVTAEILKSLPKGHAMLVFVATSKTTHAFLLNGEGRYTLWQLDRAALQALPRQATAMLREIGNYQSNHEVTLKDLEDSKWQQAGRDLLDTILKGSHADFTKKFDELIVVPDGVLWYVPFEALQVKIDGQLRPLISRFRIRYAPTAALATSPAGASHGAVDNTAVVLGHLYPRDDDNVAQNAFTQLAAAMPGAVALRSPLPAPSAVYASLLNRLIVFDDLAQSGDPGPYGWAPLPLDKSKAGSSLADWMALPWGGPDQIVLPGYHTAAEESLKRISHVAPGNEIFLSVCGLMASGAKTVLLSRWRSGGQSSYDLMREFTQELPHTTASDAWQRAVLVVTESQLNLDAEPRVKKAVVDESPKAKHPFFWAGYLLVDSGTVPPKVDIVAPGPAIKAKPAEVPPAKKP